MKRIALEGKRFGRLLVETRSENIGPHTAYACRCDCGQSVNVRGASLRRGETHSCGCLRRERMADRQTTHGLYGTPTYHSYRAMLARCYDVKHPQFKDYGGRGIKVCARWLESFDYFLADMGQRPAGRTLDRYPDSDGHYEPGNCRWATRHQQRHNRRSTQ